MKLFKRVHIALDIKQYEFENVLTSRVVSFFDPIFNRPICQRLVKLKKDKYKNTTVIDFKIDAF